ncbi:MAG: hypothetical protein LBB48_08650 [Treponema sp.]|nr:hypothetical protein [Treponema sp.]
MVIANRAYGTLNGINRYLNCGADYIPRPRTDRFAFYDKNGNKVDIACGFEDLKSGESSEAAVFAALPDKARISVRICVKRKDKERCEQSRKRLESRASRKGGKPREKTAAFNERITAVTPLPNSVAADEVLETYRLRWRAGIHFKRLKPIPDFGGLPKKNPVASAVKNENGEYGTRCAMLVKLVRMGNIINLRKNHRNRLFWTRSL